MELEVLPNLVVSVDLIMDAVEACSLSTRTLSLRNLVAYTRNSERAVREAAKAATWLGLMQRMEGGYVAASTVRGEFPAGSEKKMLLFRQHLQRKNAFIQFATFLIYGEPPVSAAAKVRVLYDMSIDSETIFKLFTSWGKSTGLFEEDHEGLRLRPEYRVSELPLEYLDGLKEALGSDMRARVFVARKLSDEAFSLIPEAGIERAVRALRGIESDPRNSVEDAGELVEDYLRQKAKTHGLSATEASGIGGVLGILARGGKVTSEHE